MYRVLVADDEEWIRKAIVKRVNTSNLNLNVVAEDSDGKEAYEMTVKQKPHIILTDIRMPFMNGIGFIEKLKEQSHDIKVIIISGYADFNYANAALRLGVFRYIVKTVDDEELYKTLKEALIEIKKEEDEITHINNLKVQLQKRTKILQKNFIYRLLTEKNHNIEYTQRMIQNLNLPFRIDDYFCMMVLQMEQSIFKLEIIESIINDLNVITRQEGFTAFILDNPIGYKEINVVLSANKKHRLTKAYVDPLVKLIINHLKHLCKHIGISKVNNTYTNLYTAYIQSIDAVKNKDIARDNNRAFTYYEDLKTSGKLFNYFTAEMERNLAYDIEEGNKEKAENIISNIFKTILKDKQVSTKLLTKLYFQIILMLQNLLKRHQVQVEIILDIDFLSLVNIPKNISIEEMESLLKLFCEKVSKYIESNKQNDLKASFDGIKNYIDSYYFDNITLDVIAQKFFISKAYFSQLFKKEVGITFISYLTRIRMEHAVELLNNNQLKVHEVAKMVGYSDPLYFGQVFKRYYGILPSEYNEKNR